MTKKLSEYVKHTVTKDVSNTDTKRQFITIAEFLETLAIDDLLLQSDAELWNTYQNELMRLGVKEDAFIDFYTDKRIDNWFTRKIDEKAGYLYRKKFMQMDKADNTINKVYLDQLKMLKDIIDSKNDKDDFQYVVINATTDFILPEEHVAKTDKANGFVDYKDWKKQQETARLDSVIENVVAVDMKTNKVIEQKQVEQVANVEPIKTVRNFFLDPMAKMLAKSKVDISTANKTDKSYSFNIKDLHKYVKKDDEYNS